MAQLIPDSTRAAAHLIREGATAAGYTVRGISFRSTRRSPIDGKWGGYHAGRDRIMGPDGRGLRDYSVRQPRDLAGLTDATSAMDVTFGGADARRHQIEFTAYLVGQGQAGKLAEVIGPNAQGQPTQWGWYNGWRAQPGRDKGHTHIGFWRDTENADRAAIFAGFFGGGAPAPVPFLATHTYRRAGRVALRESPQVRAPAVAWAASGSLIRAVAGRSGGLYRVRTGDGDGIRSRLWLEVIGQDGRPLVPSLWTAELAWVPLPSLPPSEPTPAPPSPPA